MATVFGRLAYLIMFSKIGCASHRYSVPRFSGSCNRVMHHAVTSSDGYLPGTGKFCWMMAWISFQFFCVVSANPAAIPLV